MALYAFQGLTSGGRSLEHGARQVIKPLATALALVALALGLNLVSALLDHFLDPAVRTHHILGPAQGPDLRETHRIAGLTGNADQPTHRPSHVL